MATYTYIMNNIPFSVSDESGWKGFPSKYGNEGNSWSRINSGKQVEIKPFINAVEIDWNGAKLGDTIIKIIGESALFNSCSA